MDHHVPSPVTSALRGRGYDVLTAAEDNASRQDDDELLSRATEKGRILVTQDRGFLSLTADWRSQDRPFFGVVYSPQGKLSFAELAEWLELVASTLREEEIRGQVIFLPRN
jgi:hypothetical protein